MDERVKSQITDLLLRAQQGDQQAQAQLAQIKQAADQGDQQASQIMQMIQIVAQEMSNEQPQQEEMVDPANAMYAKFGAKLNYIKRLNGQCPEGYEMKMFKAGGRVCKKCMKKAEEGIKMNKTQEGSPVNNFKAEMQKCGGKAKQKKANGGSFIPFPKAGQR